jgi:putative ABC transport system permease protein
MASVSVITPLLLRSFLKGLRSFIVRGTGVTGQLAWGNLQAGQRRLAVPVSALGGTLALTTAIAIMVGSFRETLVYWVDNSFAADLFIRPATKHGAGGNIAFSADTVALLTTHPQLLASDALRNFDIPYQNSRIILNAANFTVGAKYGRRMFKGEADWRGVLSACQETDGVVISEPLAIKYHLAVDQTISLTTPKGTHAFPIKAVYFDYSNDRGSVTMDHQTYEKYFGPVVPTNLALYLQPGANADAVRDELLQKLGVTKNVQIFTNASLRVEVMRIFDRSFSITWALEMVAILVAMAGVATTVLTLILERGEELKLLRQLGTTQAQLRKTIALEAGVIGGMSQAIGMALGLLLSLVLIYVINVQSFGWTLQFHFPWLLLGQFSVALPLATAAAGWLFAKWILQRSQHAALPLDLAE